MPFASFGNCNGSYVSFRPITGLRKRHEYVKTKLLFVVNKKSLRQLKKITGKKFLAYSNKNKTMPNVVTATIISVVLKKMFLKKDSKNVNSMKLSPNSDLTPEEALIQKERSEAHQASKRESSNSKERDIVEMIAEQNFSYKKNSKANHYHLWKD